MDYAQFMSAWRGGQYRPTPWEPFAALASGAMLGYQRARERRDDREAEANRFATEMAFRNRQLSLAEQEREYLHGRQRKQDEWLYGRDETARNPVMTAPSAGLPEPALTPPSKSALGGALAQPRLEANVDYTLGRTHQPGFYERQEGRQGEEAKSRLATEDLSRQAAEWALQHSKDLGPLDIAGKEADIAYKRALAFQARESGQAWATGTHGGRGSGSPMGPIAKRLTPGDQMSLWNDYNTTYKGPGDKTYTLNEWLNGGLEEAMDAHPNLWFKSNAAKVQALMGEAVPMGVPQPGQPQLFLLRGNPMYYEQVRAWAENEVMRGNARGGAPTSAAPAAPTAAQSDQDELSMYFDPGNPARGVPPTVGNMPPPPPSQAAMSQPTQPQGNPAEKYLTNR